MGKVLKRLGLGVSVVLAALLVGCGGEEEEPSGESADAQIEDEGTTPEQPEPLSEADFSKEANKICDARARELERLLTESDEAQSIAIEPETLASVEAIEKAATEVGRIQDELAKLKIETTKEVTGLEAPQPALLDGFEEAGKKYAAALRGVADAWRSYGKDPTEGTLDALSKAQEAQVRSSAADQKAAEKMDLDRCSQTAKEG